ncbi:MAG: amidohydrolase family protein [Gammaproteobacteria bacterium]|nr:amidohydrolase family protein [Gammaproteobacteria bacterium]
MITTRKLYRKIHRKICCTGLLAVLITSPVVADEETGITAFVNVNVVRPETNSVDKSRTVIVTGTKISRIGAANKVSVPADALVIEGKGRYLVPGLVEMHAHVPGTKQGREYVEEVLFLWVANGITTIRNMSGEASHLELREEIASRQILGPRMYTAGPRFMGRRIKTQAEAGAIVDEQVAAGYDFLKVHMGLTRVAYDGVVATAAEHDIPVAGHVAPDISLWHALEAGQATIDHLDSYMQALTADDADVSGLDDGLLGSPYTPFVDESKIAAVARATKDAGTWNVPTLTLAENFVGPYDESRPLTGAEYMPPKIVRSWVGLATVYQKSIPDPEVAQRFLGYRKRLVKALHDEGAGLLLGSDAPQIFNVPGFSLHNELDLMVEAGLTRAEALTTGTLNPAVFFDAEGTFGQVKEGLDADLVLVAENPLREHASLRNPLGVMLQGFWMTGEELQTGLELIATRYATGD